MLPLECGVEGVHSGVGSQCCNVWVLIVAFSVQLGECPQQCGFTMLPCSVFSRGCPQQCRFILLPCSVFSRECPQQCGFTTLSCSVQSGGCPQQCRFILLHCSVFSRGCPQQCRFILLPCSVFSRGCPQQCGFTKLPCRMRVLLASYKAAPHNRYKPHPAEPEQHTKCSNRAFVLLKMDIMMPETC